MKHKLATYVYSHCNICNTRSPFTTYRWNICNIHLKRMKHTVVTCVSSTCCRPMEASWPGAGGALCETRAGCAARGAGRTRRVAGLVWLYEARGAGAHSARRKAWAHTAQVFFRKAQGVRCRGAWFEARSAGVLPSKRTDVLIGALW
jgi:hypothetical protein